MLLSLLGRQANAIKLPALFFYSPPYRLSDGAIMFSPISVQKSQVAEAFPTIREMSGIAIICYWSLICPEPDRYDWSLIDHALQFWGDRGKKVILGIATVGHPMVVDTGTHRVVVGATPGWLLAKTPTYQAQTPLIAPVRPVSPPQRAQAMLPIYWSQPFIEAVSQLAARLARYDGHPAISTIRIPTGILGEDNPTFDGLKSAIPGFSNEAWISYCRTITDIHLHAFRRTCLEFDIDRLGWISARGSAADKRNADEFVSYLTDRDVFLAMNGFDEANVERWRHHDPTGPARSMDYVSHRRGREFGLEGAPLLNPRWQDVEALASAFLDSGADRLVLFADVAGVLNRVREGPNPKNELIAEAISPKAAEKIAEHAQILLKRLGFN